MLSSNLYELPEGIPAQADYGACDHLSGVRVPSLAFPSTSGGTVGLTDLPGRTVVYCFPMMGRPDHDLPPGWDGIPGARGCTPQSCAFRDHHEELRALGARDFGLSTQSTEYQREAAERLDLPFELLSDERLALTRALRLPTFEVEEIVLIKRLTFVIHDERVEKVFYPVFPPGENAAEVAGWLQSAV